MRRVCLPEMCRPWIRSQHLNTEVKLTAHSAGFTAEFISSKSQEKMEIVPILHIVSSSSVNDAPKAPGHAELLCSAEIQVNCGHLPLLM